MRMQLEGTASEVQHLLQKFDADAALHVGIEMNGHKIPTVIAEVVPIKRVMSPAARKAISRAQKKRWAKAR